MYYDLNYFKRANNSWYKAKTAGISIFEIFFFFIKTSQAKNAKRLLE